MRFFLLGKLIKILTHNFHTLATLEHGLAAGYFDLEAFKLLRREKSAGLTELYRCEKRILLSKATKIKL